MQRISKIVFFIGFISMLLLPVVFTNIQEGSVSDLDNRVLAALPEYGSAGYFSSVETWLRDRLGFRDNIVVSYAAANDAVFDELINPVYQYGRDKYTFIRIHNNIEYNDYHKQFAEMVADMQEYCESRGSHFYYVFNPEKESLYRKYLPAGVNYDDRWVDSMLSYMDELGVNYIDLRDVLALENNNKEVFDHKNDAAHWNHNGAFFGMREITRRMHSDMPQVQVLEEKEYNISSRIVEKIFGSNHTINEMVPEYSLKSECIDIKGNLATEMELDKEYSYFQLIQNDAKQAGGINRLLLFEDDLYGPFAFARSKETAIITCLQNAINFDYYYTLFKPDVVILETMESMIKDRYFSWSAMERAEHNPSIMKIFPEEGFSERKDFLLERTEEIQTDASAMLIPGNTIDRVFISKDFSKSGYTYLITDNNVIDLKDNGLGLLTARVRHNELQDRSYVILYILGINGKGQFAFIPVTSKKQNIAVRSAFTDNVHYDSTVKKYNMTHAVNGDSFAYTALRLYDADFEGLIAEIGESSSTGTVDGGYCHMLPTGDYKLLLRAGSDNIYEWAEFDVHLEEGQAYWFTYNVEEFSEKEVVISDFSFSKPAETGVEDLMAE